MTKAKLYQNVAMTWNAITVLINRNRIVKIDIQCLQNWNRKNENKSWFRYNQNQTKIVTGYLARILLESTNMKIYIYLEKSFMAL